MRKPHRLRLTNKTHNIVKTVSIAAVSAGALFALIAFGVFMLQLRATAADLQQTSAVTRQAVIDTRKDMAGMVQNTNAILIQVGLAADETRLASSEQRQELKVLNAKMEAALEQVTTDLKTFDQVQKSTKAVLDSLPPLSTELTKTVASTNKVISDPNIPLVLDNTRKVSEDVAGVTAQVNKSTLPSMNKSLDHVEKILADGELKAHQLTHPTKKQQVWGYTKEVLWILSRFMSF